MLNPGPSTLRLSAICNHSAFNGCVWDGLSETLGEAHSYTESTVAQLLLEDLRPIFQCRFGDFPSDVSLCYLQRLRCCFLSDFSIGTRILCVCCEHPRVEIDGNQQAPRGCRVSQQLPCVMEEGQQYQCSVKSDIPEWLPVLVNCHWVSLAICSDLAPCCHCLIVCAACLLWI